MDESTGVMSRQKGKLFLKGYSLAAPPNPASQLLLVPANALRSSKDGSTQMKSVNLKGGSEKDLLLEFRVVSYLGPLIHCFFVSSLLLLEMDFFE